MDTFTETSKESNFFVQLGDQVLNLIIICSCLVGYIKSSKFTEVPPIAKITLRMNYAVIIVTATVLIFRSIFQTIGSDLISYWLTNLVNFLFFSIATVDHGVVLCVVCSLVHIAGGHRNVPKIVWITFLVLAGLFSFCATAITINGFPTIINDNGYELTFGSSIFGVFSLMIAFGAAAYYLLSKDIDRTIRYSNWSFGNESYTDVRTQYIRLYIVSKQAGFNSIFKAIMLFILMFFFKKQVIYHSAILIFVSITTTISFFCHEKARLHVMYFFDLHKTYFGRTYLGAKSPYLRDSQNVCFEEYYEKMLQNWEAVYDQLYGRNISNDSQGSQQIPIQHNFDFLQYFKELPAILRKARTTFDNINWSSQRNIVDPARQPTVFVVKITPAPSIETIA